MFNRVPARIDAVDNANPEIVRAWRQEIAARAEARQQAEARFLEEERQRIEARQQAERRESDAHRTRIEREGHAHQEAQNQWATTRNALRDDVAEVRLLISEAQMRVESGPIGDAATAASEVLVYQQRLSVAEARFAQHMQQQPRWVA